MAWLETGAAIAEEESYCWRYQYAIYRNVVNQLPGSIDIGDPQDGDVNEDGTVSIEVARRIRERVQSTRWVGMKKDAARSQANDLAQSGSYRGAVARRANDANGWEVVAQKVQQHPDGWGPWKRVSDFDAWEEE